MSDKSESDVEGSVILDFDGVNSTAVHFAANPDAEFEGEVGYSLVKALRGKSAGRRLKRKLFKFGFFELSCGLSLFIICYEESITFHNIKYFDTAPYGATLQALMWCVSVPSLFFGFITWMAVRYWASLTTNRKLLGQLFKIYVACMGLVFMFALWTTCVLFLTFGKIKKWGKNVTLAMAYPYYVSTIIFLLPYLAVLILYTLDVWYLVDEIDMGGSIEEPDPPENIMDLSDVTLAQTCVFICAMPCIICVQVSDLLAAVLRAYNRHYRDSPMITLPTFGNSRRKKKTVVANKSRGFGRRLWKTIVRVFRGSKQKEVRPVTAEQENNDLELMELQKDREEMERLERERVQREADERRRAQELQEAAAAHEKQLQQERQLMEAARALAAKKAKEEEDAKRRADEAAAAAAAGAQQQEEAKEDKWEAIMNVPAFKNVWSTLATAGSFQCKLKMLPPLQALVDHLKKQGFHIVFAANPTANDVEIGVCNIRKSGTESWFMARFLATPTSFSAVMKAQNTEEVTNYVKKFALAKVLKIDTAK